MMRATVTVGDAMGMKATRKIKKMLVVPALTVENY